MELSPSLSEPSALVSRGDGTAAPMALARVLRTLRLLCDEPDGLTLAQLMAQLGAPKTSVHSLLRGLTTEGYLQRSDVMYRLGPESFVLGSAIVAARSLAIVGTPFLLEARAQSGETIMLGVIDRSANRFTYTQVIESHKPVRYTVPVGTTRPLYASAGGRVLLAFQDDAWRDQYLKTADMRAMTERTVTNRRRLARILRQVREAGFASTLGEVTPDVAGFAAPIFEPTGQVNTTFIIAAPIERGRAATERLTRVTVETAALLSQALGYRTATNRLSLPTPTRHRK